MSKLNLFMRQASIGSTVTLRLTRGEDVSGRVTELDELHVCLDQGTRIVTIFEDILAGWEIHRTEDAAKESAIPGQADQERADVTPPVPVPSLTDSSVVERQIRIDAAFAGSIERAQLEAPEPDFDFQDQEFSSIALVEARRGWDRAKSQYEYALKIHELSRLNTIIAQVLEPLIAKHPNSPSIHGLTGCFLIKLDRRTEAAQHLRYAALASKKPSHWYALAFASPPGSALECCALRHYLLGVKPTEARDAWFRYLGAALQHGDWPGLLQLTKLWSSHDGDTALQQLILETIVYVLERIEQHESAVRATALLVNGVSVVPDELWAQLESVELSPSQALCEVDEEPIEAEQSEPVVDVPRGQITSFGNLRFGFIESTEGETIFFRIDDVVDEGLRQTLQDGVWRSRAEVEFERVPSPGHKYPRAVRVMSFRDPTALLQQAQTLLQMNQHAQALGLIRRIYATNVGHPQARELETEIRRQMRLKGIGLPKGRGPYADAKRAQLADQNLEAAERLFRQAIRQGDKVESAVKDLASLLQQQGRFEEAASLLETRRHSYSGTSPYDNMLATLYQQTGRHEDAVPILQRLAQEARGTTRTSILRRLAFSYFKLTHYDEAERTLRQILEENPHDRLAERWLAGLEEAHRIGSYATAEEIIGTLGGLVEEGVELSPLAEDAIEGCRYEGVDPSRVQSGKLTTKDVERLEELAKQLGTKRPSDRAAYYLSAAAILRRLDSNEESTRLYDYLRRHFASMGDAAWIDKKPADVVRTFYLESLALVFDYQLDEAWRTLVRYLATFSPEKLEQLESLLPKTRRRREDYVAALRAILESVILSPSDGWMHALLDACAQSGFTAQGVWDAIASDRSLQRSLAGLVGADKDADIKLLKEAWYGRVREFARARQNSMSVCRTLTRHQLAAASMEDLGSQLRITAQTALCELDRRRVGDLLDIAQSALGFCRTSDFEDREQHYWLVTTRAQLFAEQVRSAPTQFAFAALLSVAEHLRSLTEEEYAQTVRTSAARLELCLLVDSYIRGYKGEVRLQVEVSNKQGCSPASSVRLVLGPPSSAYFSAPDLEREITATLRGGSSAAAHMVLRPSERALAERAFPIKVRAYYRNRIGEECSTEEREWTVRLYPETEFVQIPNRYAPYAEGGPVDDPEMFIGRDELLSRLDSSLLAGSGSKCIVVFGQKRAGKSSLLEHLRLRLRNRSNCVPIAFSLQDIAPGLSESAFLYRILQSLKDALEEMHYTGAIVPEFAPPSLEEMMTHPSLKFHDAMSSLIRYVRREDSASRLAFVLLVDEFTDIYKQIRRGKIAPEFMKAWKAIIEKRYFASVLVGQDIMPTFKSSFPNEFGVTEDVRITYLAERDAMKLIEEPVGASRYAGRAVRRILDLTAGSPYYTMMFCSRMVDYMNRTRSAVITEADVAAVEQEMLAGDRRLTKDKFDNLISAGDGREDTDIDPGQTTRVCARIAKGSDRGWCSREAIHDVGADELDMLLTDLERRDILERKGDAYRIRVGLFHDWLLIHG